KRVLPVIHVSFNAAPPPESYTLSLHDALPILMDTGASPARASWARDWMGQSSTRAITSRNRPVPAAHLSFMTKFSTPPWSLRRRSEEHTSELQSRFDLVCRLLLEKKKTTEDKP